MRARGLLVALLAVAVAAWAIMMAWSSPPPPPLRAAAPVVTPPIVRDISDLDRASARLAGRTVSVAPSSAPARNPFEFAVARPKPAARPTPAAALAAVAPAFMLPPPLPSVSLVGLVDREVNGRTVRIAVLSFGGTLHYVEAGNRLGGAYEVVAVGTNAVDLLALDTNTPRRLVQR
jgi:hypothetical protein